MKIIASEGNRIKGKKGNKGGKRRGRKQKEDRT